MKFEATGLLAVNPERGKTCVAVQVVDEIMTQLEEYRIFRLIDSTSV